MATLETLVERVESSDERVPSSLIKAEFDKIMATGVVASDIDLYMIIEGSKEYSYGGTRKIVEGSLKTGPRDLLEFLESFQQSETFEQLKQKLKEDINILNTLPKLARKVIETYGFRSQLVFTDYLLEQLGPKHPTLKRDNIRDSLFHRPDKKIRHWHYPVYQHLKLMEEGNVTVPTKYLRFDFKTYQRLLKFAYWTLTKRDNLSKDQFGELMGTILGISPKTVITHLYRKSKRKDIKGNYSEPRDYYNKLLDYILNEILITVSLKNPENPKEDSKQIEETVNSYPKRNRIMIISDQGYQNTALMQIFEGLKPYQKRDYQITFVFNPNNIEQAILSFKLPEKPSTPYTTSPASRS